MKAEKQIKIARVASFILSALVLAAPPLFIHEKMQGGESITWQSALLFMGFMYILILPLAILFWVYTWALNHRKRKTAFVFFALLVILNILSFINLLIIPQSDVPIMAILFELTIPIVIVVLLLQGILGLRKLHTVQSSPEIMTKNQRTPAQRWHEIDFSNRLTDTSLWIRMADELVDAANILEAEVEKYWSEIKLDEHHHPVKTSNRKYVQGPYSLLVAYALENYFKALLIHQNQKDLKGWLLTKLPGYLRQHDLGRLASESKFKLDTSEEELLCRLSRSSIWAARYPVPIEPEALANMKKFSNGQSYLIAYYAPQDIKRIHDFIGRLRNHVLTEIANNT